MSRRSAPCNLITSYLLGIAINRYVIRLDPIASMSEDDVVRLVAPTIQDWLHQPSRCRVAKSDSAESEAVE